MQAQQYYAHPRNAFWPIMAQLFDVNIDADYLQRVAQLEACKVSVWDVLYDCERPGSLDSDIKLASEVVNDFSSFFGQQPSIEAVAFNGLAARKIFQRHCKGVYDKFPEIRWVDLPSSSPAYAAMNLSEKTRVWSQKLLLAPD